MYLLLNQSKHFVLIRVVRSVTAHASWNKTVAEIFLKEESEKQIFLKSILSRTSIGYRVKTVDRNERILGASDNSIMTVTVIL